MSTGFFKVPKAKNEIVKSYEPNSSEIKEVLKTYNEMINTFTEVPLYINGNDVKTKEKKSINPPHDHGKIVGEYHLAQPSDIDLAIDSALKAKKSWEAMSWENRSAIFLKAAELIAGPYRSKINAATMISQSKTVHQAEIDSACELIDFLRFNVEYVTQIYSNQPASDSDAWNRVEYRPLEGFVYAVTPFNVTAIAGNLPTCMAMLGNVVIWKPSSTQIFSAKVIIDVLKEAGLPGGVINAVYGNASMITEKVLERKEFSGLHFTGSTSVFNSFWKTIGENISNYNTYPKIVGETGGKDFIVAHESANSKEVSTAIIRGCFEFQGQKCSAPSRIYLPKSLWPSIKKELLDEIKTIKIGEPDDFSNFMNAVIDERAFNKIVSYIEGGKKDKDLELLIGGDYDSSKGYFINPTVFVTNNPKNKLMVEEVFGPVTCIYIYEDKEFDKTLKLVDETSPYALTGAIFASEQVAIDKAMNALEYSAGNFYINDKPTGAVVGQQPFGGGRASGTNDKAGSYLNLLRWVSPRTIKEVYNTPKNYRYPFLKN